MNNNRNLSIKGLLTVFFPFIFYILFVVFCFLFVGGGGGVMELILCI